MQQIEPFADIRQGTWCIHCGSTAKGSRDHVPSKVFLDRPYPENLPVVDICGRCNQGFSLDEQYLSCFLECVVCGSTDPERLERAKIRRTLSQQVELRSRIERSKRDSDTLDGDKLIVWQPEQERVRNVILKLARGHASFELNEPMMDEPDAISIAPLHLSPESDGENFEASPIRDSPIAPWPEVGSRAMQRLMTGAALVDGWIEVQEERYRCQIVGAGFVSVRMVLRDYLAAEVVWQI